MRVHYVVRWPDVIADRGVNDELSQETTQMATGALSPCSLIRSPVLVTSVTCHPVT